MFKTEVVWITIPVFGTRTAYKFRMDLVTRISWCYKTSALPCECCKKIPDLPCRYLFTGDWNWRELGHVQLGGRSSAAVAAGLKPGEIVVSRHRIGVVGSVEADKVLGFMFGASTAMSMEEGDYFSSDASDACYSDATRDVRARAARLASGSDMGVAR